jgi:tRNA pseudouridine65 synthase
MDLSILYADDDYVAIDKPSGLLVHRTALDKDATVFALQLLRDQLGREVHLCHRLDRPTSGVLLFALNVDAMRHANREFAERRVHKIYHAIVRGWIEKPATIDYALRLEDTPNKFQDSKTDYTCVKQCQVDLPVGNYDQARFTLVELRPLTGRKHQLRRHMAHIRHPILGDTRHGDGTQNKFIREHFDCHRLLLHASSLAISHPRKSTPIEICSDYRQGFGSIVGDLKL